MFPSQNILVFPCHWLLPKFIAIPVLPVCLAHCWYQILTPPINGQPAPFCDVPYCIKDYTGHQLGKPVMASSLPVPVDLPCLRNYSLLPPQKPKLSHLCSSHNGPSYAVDYTIVYKTLVLASVVPDICQFRSVLLLHLCQLDLTFLLSLPQTLHCPAFCGGYHFFAAYLSPT